MTFGEKLLKDESLMFPVRAEDYFMNLFFFFNMHIT